MTVDEIKTTAKRHRSAALLGGMIGLLLLAGYLVYNVAMTPARPDLHVAAAAEIVAYITDDRGLAKLPQIEEQQFLRQWQDLVMEDPKKKDELKACIAGLDDRQRKAFSESMFGHGKRAFIDDAKRYANLPQDQTYEFLRKGIAEYRAQLLFMKDVAEALRGRITGTPDDFQKWVIEHSSAEERALGEPYVDALKRVRTQLRKRQRDPAAPPAESAAGDDTPSPRP